MQDAYVEKSPTTVDVTLSTSSTSLRKPRIERIINKKLKTGSPPPWGHDTAENWRNRSAETNSNNREVKDEVYGKRQDEISFLQKHGET